MGVGDAGVGWWTVEAFVGLLLFWVLVRVVGWFVDRRRARKDPAWAERRRKQRAAVETWRTRDA